jgi:general secretion pathway protein E
MISRLKSLSRLDIAEKRKPQDGRIQLMLQNVPTEVRLSTIPVAFGEKMVLRLLSKETSVKGLSQMGMSDEQFERFDSFLGQSYGLILVTGPTGSGKSTTLYSALKNLATPTINVVTVEDPIEMVVEEFNQIGVQDRVGVSFSNILRHILRQDPDIVMIGEIRDLDTAQQAVQASLTGHLVFSTLHTNDAVSALTRLTDIGLEPYLINASLVGVMAQRLVRCICPHCKTRLSVSSEQIRNWGLERHAPLLEGEVCSGTGCEHCRQTGYLGRTGIFEILPMDLKLKEGVRQGLELAELRRVVRSSGVRSLLESGLDKVGQGVTTVEEVLRVTGEIDDPYQ